MSRTLRYAGTCFGIAGLVVLGAAVTLDRAGARGVLFAAAAALVVQVAAFAVLARQTIGTNRFLAAWLGGTVVRFVAVGLAGWALLASPGIPPLPTLLSLAGLFFVMLLLEPAFLGLRGTRATRDQVEG